MMREKIHAILTGAMHVLLVLFLATACAGIAFAVETYLRFGKVKDNPEAKAAVTVALCMFGLAEIFMILAGILGFIVGRRQRAARKEQRQKSIATQPESEQQALEYQERLRRNAATKP